MKIYNKGSILVSETNIRVHKEIVVSLTRSLLELPFITFDLLHE